MEEAEPQPGGERPYLDAKVYVYDHPESRHEPGAHRQNPYCGASPLAVI